MYIYNTLNIEYSYNNIKFEYLTEDIIKDIDKQIKESINDSEYYSEVLLPKNLDYEYDKEENFISITNKYNNDICIIDNKYEDYQKFAWEIINYICLKQYNDLINLIKLMI